MTVYLVHLPESNCTWVYLTPADIDAALDWLYVNKIPHGCDSEEWDDPNDYHNLPDETWEFPSK